MPHAPLEAIEGAEVFDIAARRARTFAFKHGRLNRLDDVLGDLVLQGKQIV